MEERKDTILVVNMFSQKILQNESTPVSHIMQKYETFTKKSPLWHITFSCQKNISQSTEDSSECFKMHEKVTKKYDSKGVISKLMIT